MKRTNKYILNLFITAFLFYLLGSCANPFGKGTWRPLPLKKWQKTEINKNKSEELNNANKKTE